MAYYNQEITHDCQIALANQDDFSIAIRMLFAGIFETFADKNEPNGCLIVNSMVSEVLCDDALNAFNL